MSDPRRTLRQKGARHCTGGRGAARGAAGGPGPDYAPAMFRLETEQDLLRTFRARDRKHVELPPGLRFPLFVPDYLAWVDPHGVRTFLVFSEPGSRLPIGIAFRREPSGPGAPVGGMCDWCHHSGSSQEIGFLTTEASSRRTVGVHVCLDLRCKQHLEEDANRTGRHPLPPTKALLGRMRQFAREALGIEVAPDPQHA